MNEKELVKMILAGNVEAFEPLVRPYRQPLFSLASRMTTNVEDAKEACQEALLKAFRYLRNYDSERSFRNWLFGILVNEVRKIRKVRTGAPNSLSTDPWTMPELASNEIPPDELISRAETRSQLMDCLEALSSRERDVFLLREIEELSIKDTAGMLGASSISVRVHLSRARRKMRDAILERYPHLVEDGR